MGDVVEFNNHIIDNQKKQMIEISFSEFIIESKKINKKSTKRLLEQIKEFTAFNLNKEENSPIKNLNHQGENNEIIIGKNPIPCISSIIKEEHNSQIKENEIFNDLLSNKIFSNLKVQLKKSKKLTKKTHYVKESLIKVNAISIYYLSDSCQNSNLNSSNYTERKLKKICKPKTSCCTIF